MVVCHHQTKYDKKVINTKEEGGWSSPYQV